MIGGSQGCCQGNTCVSLKFKTSMASPLFIFATLLSAHKYSFLSKHPNSFEHCLYYLNPAAAAAAAAVLPESMSSSCLHGPPPAPDLQFLIT